MSFHDTSDIEALRLRFREAIESAPDPERERAGIGTLSEKTLHAVLKRFIESNEAFHEIKLGRSYADIYNGEGVFEIQTRAFNRLRTKLSAMLETERVTIVYPIPATKRLIWLNAETGELSPPRKSPRRGSFYDAFYELYKLGGLIEHDSLRILLLLIDMDEYRFLDGWSKDGKRGSTRCERLPKELSSAFMLSSAEDYLRLLPPGLPMEFTSKELAKAAKIRLAAAQTMLTVLRKRGALRCIGKAGRLNLYEAAHQ